MPTGINNPPFPSVAADATVVAKTGTGNLAASDYGKNITNTGAGGGIVLTLLAAAAVAGQCFNIQVTAAQTVTLTPQSGEKVWLGGSGVASKYALIAGVIGNFCQVYSDGVGYHITNYSGVVTKEA